MHERFLQLLEAYVVLSDPVRRRALDEALRLRHTGPRRRRHQGREFIAEFFVNLLRGMMR